jgi:hypothetical protein
LGGCGGLTRSCADGEGFACLGGGKGGVEEGDSGLRQSGTHPSANARTDGAPGVEFLRVYRYVFRHRAILVTASERSTKWPKYEV